MKDIEPPKFTPDTPTDEIVRLLTPVIMLSALENAERLFLILGLLKFDFSNVGLELTQILYR